MRKIILLSGLIILASRGYAQVSGSVVDASSKEKIPGAVVEIENSFFVSVTDADGKFLFPTLKEKHVHLKVSHLGFELVHAETDVPNTHLEIALTAKTYLSGEAVVTATRASDKSPTAFSTVDKKEIEKKNLGQDVPFLLNTLPSVVVTSDAGNGVGYTGIRIRGSDPTRVNVTINGVPINDAEENGLYWVDLPDFASSIENIQVQRGIGTSTNGAGAFGASVNILSQNVNSNPYASLAESYGSFNTWKNTFQFGTGILKNKFAFEGRLSKISSDGFIDRASSDLKSFYLSGGYYGSRTSLRAIIFSGKEKTYQSWNGVPEAKLKNDAEGLVSHYYNNLGYLYNTTDDSINLFESDSRTYNGFTYKNQTDNYQQDYYQLLYSYATGKYSTLNAAVHYTKGRGYYEEYKYNQLFSAYGLNDVVDNNGDTVATGSNLIRQKWLDNDFYGFTLSSVYNTDKIEYTAGAAANWYDGRHYDQIIWAEHASNSAKDYIYDDNDAEKTDANVFGKAIYTVGSNLHLFGDLQFRSVDYSFLGFGENFENAQQKVHHDFFNPKAGVSYDFNKKTNAYLSFAIGHKEPIRGDYINSTAASRPEPETMQDIEAGYKYSGSRLKASFNFYNMNYKDQLILTGEINDVGAYTRMNVPKSFRRGIEIEVGASILKSLAISGNITLSQNEIKEFTEFVDSYDADFNSLPQTEIKHDNTAIAFSPDVISALTISWLPVKNLSLDLITKYVGDQFLDNTENNSRKLDAYLTNDFIAEYHFALPYVKNISLKLAVYNFLNELYESNGYTYGYLYDGQLIQENFYFPQAGTNWMGGVTIGF
jgi:iron complex outermembrane receptor protein